ncbi:MAG: PAS domain S-box protein [Polyangiaceae bacterium]|nr:PAS domain S-box protein [Polyangiaceae bacterium]
MTSALRILLVEDSVTDAKLVLQELRRTGRPIESERVETAEAMNRALDRGHWDLVISDWSMPQFSAESALDVMSERRLDLPFIIVSGTIGEDTAVAAMRAGAHDYVLKDKLGRLIPAVERELREFAERERHRHNEARRIAMFESALDAIVGMDHAGRITEFNPAAEKTFGYGREEVVGRELADVLIPLGQREKHRAGIARFMGGGGGTVIGKRIEVTALRRDGTEFPAELSVTRVGTETPPEFMGFIRDISDRKRAELALRESEERFTRLCDAGIIGITVVDYSGKTHVANDAFLSMLGYSREELLGGAVRWSDITPPEWRARDGEAFEQLRASGVANPWEKEFVRKDGSRVPVLIGMALVSNPTSICFVVDQSERRRDQEEKVLLRYEATLEKSSRMTAERALRTSEEQLRHVQKMDAVGRLAGGVAHDFNNLLSVILSYGEMMLTDLRSGDPMRGDVEEIRKAAARGASLTHQLLLFSRQKVAEARVLDLNEVLSQMDRMLQRILGEDIELVLVPAKSVGRVSADPTHIEQVVMNLVVNARDAMPRGGKLTIETSNVDLDEHYAQHHFPVKPGPHVMMAVSDTGVGMDKTTQMRIFEPFFTTKGVGKGTGLGLSTVFGIIQQSGGNIWVYSEPGKGTTFKIYLPRVEADVDIPQPVAPPATSRGTETLLVVEDEEQVRAIVLNALRRHGYHVIAARNAGEALLICETHADPIDLLLTDVVMPEMSGPDLARRLVVTRPGMKVVCMSGYTDDSIVRHGVLESGMAFIQKPITPSLLTKKIREVLDQPGTTSPKEGTK